MASTRALVIRRAGLTTLRIAIPREFVLRRELDEGDQVVWEEEEDGVKLKFFRVMTSITPAFVEQEEQPVMAA